MTLTVDRLSRSSGEASSGELSGELSCQHSTGFCPSYAIARSFLVAKYSQQAVFLRLRNLSCFCNDIATPFSENELTQQLSHLG